MLCPSESELAAYSEGRVRDDERPAIEAHLAVCEECRQLVSMLVHSISAGSAPTVAAGTIDSVPDLGYETHSIGDVLGGKYRIERVVGSGGMGVVLEATHLGLNQRVAIKLLKRDAKRVHGAIDRFVREARICAQIKSAHAVRVLDTGQFESGEPYIVMELLEGEDLRARVAKVHALPIEDAVDFIIEACDALDEAHAAGIVHRDIKPANLFVTTDKDGRDVVKVLDFGISKLQAEDVAVLTSQNAAIGSPRYMSPEQLKSPRSVDARTDIWALGVVLYEMITGDAAFDSDSMAGLAACILTEDPKRITRANMPAVLEAVIRRCLAKSAADRFDNVRLLAAALRDFGTERTHPIADRFSRGSNTLRPPAPRNSLPARPKKSGRWVVGAFVALGFAAAGTGVVIVRTRTPYVSSAAVPLIDAAPEVVATTLPTAAFAASAEVSAIVASSANKTSAPVRGPRVPVVVHPSSPTAPSASSIVVPSQPPPAPAASSGVSSALRDRK